MRWIPRLCIDTPLPHVSFASVVQQSPITIRWTAKLGAQLTSTNTVVGTVLSKSTRAVYWVTQSEIGGVDVDNGNALFARNLSVNLGTAFVSNPTRALGIAGGPRDSFAVYARCQSILDESETRLCINVFDARRT